MIHVENVGQTIHDVTDDGMTKVQGASRNKSGIKMTTLKGDEGDTRTFPSRIDSRSTESVCRETAAITSR